MVYDSVILSVFRMYCQHEQDIENPTIQDAIQCHKDAIEHYGSQEAAEASMLDWYKSYVPSIKRMIKFCDDIGGGFHPDSFIGDYVTQDDKPSFTDEECKTLQKELDECWSVLGDDIYTPCLVHFDLRDMKEDLA